MVPMKIRDTSHTVYCTLNTVHHTLDDSTLYTRVFSLNSLLSPDRFAVLVDGHDHAGAHGRGEGVDEVVKLPQERVFQVEREVQCGEDAGHSGGYHEEAVTVVGVHGNESFAGVEPALGEAHTEERVAVGGRGQEERGKREEGRGTVTGRGREGRGKRDEEG